MKTILLKLDRSESSVRSGSGSLLFARGSVSPVKLDSSTVRLLHAMIRASAGCNYVQKLQVKDGVAGIMKFSAYHSVSTRQANNVTWYELFGHDIHHVAGAYHVASRRH